MEDLKVPCDQCGPYERVMGLYQSIFQEVLHGCLSVFVYFYGNQDNQQSSFQSIYTFRANKKIFLR